MLYLMLRLPDVHMYVVHPSIYMWVRVRNTRIYVLSFVATPMVYIIVHLSVRLPSYQPTHLPICFFCFRPLSLCFRTSMHACFCDPQCMPV